MNPQDVLTCGVPKCKLVQFRGQQTQCRRCRFPFPVFGAIVEFATPPEPDQPSLTLGERAYVLRKRAGFSQRHLAKRMGCQRTYVSKIECGALQPTIPMVMRLAAGLQCDIGELFPDTRPALLRDIGDPELAAFMAELCSYAGRLTNQMWIAVRRKAQELCTQVVIAHSA